MSNYKETKHKIQKNFFNSESNNNNIKNLETIKLTSQQISSFKIKHKITIIKKKLVPSSTISDDNVPNNRFSYIIENLPDFMIPFIKVNIVFSINDAYKRNLSGFIESRYKILQLDNTHYKLDILVLAGMVDNFIAVETYFDIDLVLINERNIDAIQNTII